MSKKYLVQRHWKRNTNATVVVLLYFLSKGEVMILSVDMNTSLEHRVDINVVLSAPKELDTNILMGFKKSHLTLS